MPRIAKAKVAPKKPEPVKLGSNQILRSQLIEAYDKFDCGTWRNNITEILAEKPLAKDSDVIDIPNKAIRIFRADSTASQKEYVRELGINLQEDLNAFINKFSSEATKEISNRLFGDSHTLQVSVGATPEDRSDLTGRSLYFHGNVTVKIHKAHEGSSGTVVEITKTR